MLLMDCVFMTTMYSFLRCEREIYISVRVGVPSLLFSLGERVTGEEEGSVRVCIRRKGGVKGTYW